MEKFKLNKTMGNIIIGICIVIIIYLGISLYFIKHFNLGTVINGVNVSGKTIKGASEKLKNEVEVYNLEIIGRDDKREDILGKDIELKYNGDSIILNTKKEQNFLSWILGIFNKREYKFLELCSYNEEILMDKISNLECIGCDEVIEPKSARLEYVDGGYIILDEVYGNKIKKDVSYEVIKNSIATGERFIDLENLGCYENPKYTRDSEEIIEAKNILNKYVSSEITYIFGDEEEVLEGSIIKNWLKVNDDLEVSIDEKRVKDYVAELANLYDTVGITREFKTAYGSEIQVRGGYYGWKINKSEEFKSLMESIKNGEVIDRDPVYAQKGVTRGANDIGDTYVEISMNRQYLWFYKDGKIIAQGDVVTGDVNKGHKTALGTYMLTYKQKGATLTGDNYSSDVKYWMPFNGNIGMHDASWRYSFGGDIYKNNGSHGCVNMPEYTAKKIFDNIEDGTPVIVYYD